MRNFIIFTFLFLPFFGCAQIIKPTDDQFNGSGASKLIFANNVLKAAELAKSDIEKKIPFLLLQGGIDPVIYPTDNQFQQKYNVYFYEFGCTDLDYTFAAEYNKVIFGYLTQKYGKKWTRNIRTDVIGFKELKHTDL